MKKISREVLKCFSICLLGSTVLLPSQLLYAGSFLDLTPGKSKKTDADTTLGEPVKELLHDMCYEYDPKEASQGRILVTVDRETKVIKTINIFLREKQKKGELAGQYELEKPAKTRIGANDQLIEYYVPEGISLHYDGENEESSIESICYFDPEIIRIEKETPNAEKEAVDSAEEPGVITYTSKSIVDIGKASAKERENIETRQNQEKTQAVVDSSAEVLSGRQDPNEDPEITVEDSQEQDKAESKRQETKPVFEVIFADDFDSENKGRGQFNYREFRHWHVSGGEVDLIGHGFWDFYPDYGMYIDLDGNVNRAGTLRSKAPFRLAPGIYRLEFDLAGHPMRTKNTVAVSIDDAYGEVFALDAKEPFRTIQRDISVTAPVTAALVFRHHGGDNAGLLLDNVRLSMSVAGPRAAGKTSPGNAPATQGTRAYLSVQVVKHQENGVKIMKANPDSPAERAGLRAGDTILRIENISFEQKGIEISRFTAAVSKLPTDRPLTFVIERNQKQFEVWIKLEEMTAGTFRALSDSARQEFKSKDNFQLGVDLVRQRKFSQAIGYFKKTMTSRPRESLEMLGVSYFCMGNMKEAFAYLEKAYVKDKTAPYTVYYIAMYYDRVGKDTHATHYYKEFLRLRFDNPKMRSFATERLRELAGRRRRQTVEDIEKILDVVIKGMETP